MAPFIAGNHAITS